MLRTGIFPSWTMGAIGSYLGIHPGLVVVHHRGGSGRQEQLALGEAPNAAPLQGLAAPNTVVISAGTSTLESRRALSWR